MKRITSLISMFFVIGLIAVTVATTSAQRVNTTALASGVHTLTDEEFESARKVVRANRQGSSKGPEQVSRLANSAGSTPVFLIRTTGDIDSGITADVFNSAVIPRSSIAVGVRISPAGNVEYLFAYQFDYDVPAGYFYANLDNQKKLAYSEQGGVQRYEIWHLQSGNPTAVYAAEANARNGSSYQRARNLIYKSSHENKRRTIEIYGEFGPNVGVFLRDKDIGYTIFVPQEAITVTPGRVTIKLPKVTDFEYILPGDVVVSIVDGLTNFTSTGAITYNPIE